MSTILRWRSCPFRSRRRVAIARSPPGYEDGIAFRNKLSKVAMPKATTLWYSLRITRTLFASYLMTQYPIILIPPQIERVKSAQPLPIQAFSQSPPTSPGAQPQKLNFTLIGIEAALAVPLAAIISRITLMPVPLIFLVAVSAILKLRQERWPQGKSEISISSVNRVLTC
jgi:hypothetical protein